MRRVDVTRLTKGYAVIGKGLKEGEQVITEGINKVRPGIAVNAAQTGS
jgi:membrane fusion protein (multidrug efflux system)